MHTTYIHIHTHTQEGGKKSLKNTKINYTRSSASLLANFLGRFLKIFFLCAASLSPSKVCHSFSTNLFLCRSLFVHFEVSATSPHLGVRSAQWWHYQETGVQYDDYRLGSRWSKFVLSKKRKEKKLCPLSVEDKCFICFHTNFSSRLNYCLHSLFQHCTSFHVVSLYIPPRIHKTKTKKKR